MRIKLIALSAALAWLLLLGWFTWGLTGVVLDHFKPAGKPEIQHCIEVDWITDTCVESPYYHFFN